MARSAVAAVSATTVMALLAGTAVLLLQAPSGHASGPAVLVSLRPEVLVAGDAEVVAEVSWDARACASRRATLE
eukprot:CAMPEP_0198441730 /NCGR_PEP_ID=MMETSP1452-20131203/63833_1 /TAXON_ID=1181717 /ORGANISM="Synchroma pusillum, Strain CCMP3072" /LENGTH=73 /DNA_ID=CAMNT_0044162357 /DNA_START=10 /DNA_END=228 /DNA_ORIENTATION=+